MNRPVKFTLRVLGVLFGLFILLFSLAGAPWLLESVVRLVVGWAIHAGSVLPKVTVNWSGVGMMAVCVALTAFLGHRFCAWLWRGSGHPEPWRPRWTFAGLGMVVVMFGAGMAITAVAHQTGWLLRSPERLISSGGNERNASTSLKTISAAQADFRANDRDFNQVNDFWRGDLAGLYAVVAQGYAIKLIEISVALADDRPVVDMKPYGEASPKAGYWYRALKYKDETKPDPNRFAAGCWPQSPSQGIWMFIINEENTIWRKPFEGQPLDYYPDDPLKDGWEKLY